MSEKAEEYENQLVNEPTEDVADEILSKKQKRQFLYHLITDVLKSPDYLEEPFRKMLLDKLVKVGNNEDKFNEMDVVRHAIPFACMVSKVLFDKAKEMGKPLYFKPIVDTTKSEEIHFICVVPKFRHAWDFYFALWEVVSPNMFPNAATSFLKGLQTRKLHPDFIENFDNDLLGYITLYAQGAKENSFFKNPVDCIFNISGIAYLLGNNYDLETPMNVLLQNSKLMENLSKEFQRTEQFVTGSVDNINTSTVYVPPEVLLAKLHITN